MVLVVDALEDVPGAAVQGSEEAVRDGALKVGRLGHVAGDGGELDRVEHEQLSQGVPFEVRFATLGVDRAERLRLPGGRAALRERLNQLEGAA